jgi:syndecan 2
MRGVQLLQDSFAVLLAFLLLHQHFATAEYVYENGQWVWKDDQPSSSINSVETDDRDRDSEGSGDYYDSEDNYYYEGSGEDDYYEEDYNSHKDKTNWKDNINNKNDKNNNYNSWNTDNVNKYDNYNANNDEDIQLTDDVKTTIQIQQVTTTTQQPTTVVKLTTKPTIVGNSNIHPTSFFAQPGILAAVVGGAVVGLLCAILLVMFIVYRMRKKDEGSYSLDEPRRSPNAAHLYAKANSREFFA